MNRTTIALEVQLLSKVFYLLAKIDVDSSNRRILVKSKNKYIFKCLTRIKCFDFYCTNNGNIIGLSQVVAYLSYGWKAYLNGFKAPKSEIEVHHINSDVTDNSPNNLIYLSRQDHAIVSSYTYTPFHGRLTFTGSTPFNRQGAKVSNPTHFLVNVIQETVSCVAKHRSSQEVKLTFLEILSSIPKQLWKGTPLYSIMPRWMNTVVQNKLNPNLLYRC